MDPDMTPLTRLIPESSGNNGEFHRTERGSIRDFTSSGGDGRVPPIRPSEMELAPMDNDIVSEILRDSQDIHPSQYQEPEYEVEPPSYEPPPRPSPRPQPRPQSDQVNDDEEGGSTDYIGLILDEIKLPLIVALLILGTSASGMDDILVRIIPALGGNSGYLAILIKAIVGGLLFYALKRIFL